ncbi:hypothetical protein [Nitrosomonas sp.]|uniref:hypothetical protein n=1 Tax=Nitrosomonas sp. TaxID=42353 RepID=UPI0025D588A7|nr:hypothetical protein [Nitrosomonas sp.]MCC6917045.1 hypothetical protein [Nitrosomonas sp.]
MPQFYFIHYLALYDGSFDLFTSMHHRGNEPIQAEFFHLPRARLTRPVSTG